MTQKQVNWKNGPSATLNYTYDINGNVSNLGADTSGGVTNVYQYDPLNRLTNVLANGSVAAAYAYDLAGNLQAMRYGNGVTNQYQYDSLNRLTNSLWKSNTLTLASFYYQLERSGNRTNLSEVVGGANRVYSWQYDNLYRLVNETFNASSNITYSYDAVGNRMTRTSGIGVLTNQSLTFNTNDWLTIDTYDSNGNTITSNGTNYQYDVMNHVTNAVINGSAIIITYDGDGLRQSKKVGSTTTYYLVDDRNPSGYSQVLEERTVLGSTTNLSKVYNYGLDLISQRQPNTSTNYFIFDGHGSTRMLTDIGGSSVNVMAYDAYGDLITPNAIPQTGYLYSGQQYDSDLGLYYNRARYLNTGTGRFVTMDTYEGNDEGPLSLHKYLYTEDNPVNMSDPSGNDGLADLTLSMNLGTMLAGLTLTGIAAADVYSHGKLAQVAVNETIQAGGHALAATEAALSVYSTSVRDLIKQAKDQLKNATKSIRQLKIVPMPRSVIPNVANLVAMAQASGKLMVLTRTTPAQAILNRVAATRLSPSAGIGRSLDEYPFASSIQGGLGSSVAPVPALENSIQGGIIGGCYTIERITPGTAYIVVVTP